MRLDKKSAFGSRVIYGFIKYYFDNKLLGKWWKQLKALTFGKVISVNFKHSEH